MKRSQIPLHAVRAFEAAARHESFSKAADELSVTPSAISRHVATLEDFVGGSLFHREIRRVELTDLGQQLQVVLGPLFDDLSRSLELTRMRAADVDIVARPFRIGVLASLATRLVIPNLDNFQRRHPGIDHPSLTILASFEGAHDRDWDLILGCAKQAVPESEDVLFREEALMVASPRYLDNDGIRTPVNPAEVMSLRLIGSTPDHWDLKAWCQWAGVPWPKDPTLMVVETDDLAIQAALAGAGATLAESRFVANELADGRLVHVSTGGMFEIGYYTAQVVGREHNEEAAQFRNWLVQIPAV